MPTLSQTLADFATLDLATGATEILAALGYHSDKTETLATPDAAGFAAAFSVELSKRAQTENWKEVQLLFQLTADELTGQRALLGQGYDEERFESFLFFALDLKPTPDGKAYSRTALANMARELNKPFPMPVIVIFRHGDTMSLASLHRRPDKRNDNRDVSERVVLLKDIRLDDPHRAHVDILTQLAGIKAKNWADFLKEWNRVLDISELNKRFFSQLSDWYFHARHHCVFPKPKGDDKTGEEHISTSLIRLITRVMFSYFLKERGLVPAALFDSSHVAALLRDTDDKSSTYYKAVLQNLFFATLNTEMSERDWKVASKGGYNEEFMVHNKRRYGDYFQNRDAAAALFDSVPFLNGGLFECLDKTQKDRYDGFSERADNPLSVPNALFWGEDVKVDLTAEYGGDAGKPIIRNVRSLLNLFASYKWTVAENTPLEEEVALDPELLGKVFENLLASYNPETKATARKQSGSFYTPREIVDYMVTESLVAYLGAQTALDADTLRGLFAGDAGDAATDDQGGVAALDGAQKRAIIAAIEKLKLLDPAVGSGAFPMGALQSLVGLLQKIDPNNQLWRAQLESSARALTVGSEGALEQIAQVWRRDGGDYARKLYLIENCLFGVDIQPIAIQIAKLRFFIALAIEQKGNDDRADNFGIRPLPNLETKLVAANTLLELHKSGDVPISSAETVRLQGELEGVRADHFKAQKWKKKKELRDEDKRLRGELAVELKDIGMAGGAAELLAHWNPYDQNASAGFFDPRWMFGIEEGFDVVIGNPPYIFARDSAAKGITDEDKKYYASHFKLAQYQINLYALFIEQGVNSLRDGGVLSFITPNNWLTINTNKVLREFVLQQSDISIVNFLKQVFESADVDAAVMVFRKGRHSPDTEVSLYEWTDELHEITKAQASFFQAINDSIINIEALKGGDTHAIMAKMETASNSLGKVAEVRVGLKAYQTGKGKPPQTVEIKNARRFHSRAQENKEYIPYLDGRDVSRYHLGWGGEYLEYGKHLAEPRSNFKLFSSPRILVRQIPAPPPYCIHACFTEETLLNDLNSMNIINIQKKPLFVLGVLNSRATSWWFVHKFGKMQRGTFPQFKVNELATFPIPAATPSQQAEISGLVEAILAARAADVGADVSPLEAQIDALVYALYGLSDDEIALVEAA